MITISILPEEPDRYRALAGDKESTGRTAGEALDALRLQMTVEAGSTLVIVQEHKPDRFFNVARRERLAELMRLREAGTLSAEGQQELEGLVEAELFGARRRAEVMTGRVAFEIQLSDCMAEVRESVARGVEDRAARPKILIERPTGGGPGPVKPGSQDSPGKTDSDQ